MTVGMGPVAVAMSTTVPVVTKAASNHTSAKVVHVLNLRF